MLSTTKNTIINYSTCAENTAVTKSPLFNTISITISIQLDVENGLNQSNWPKRSEMFYSKVSHRPLATAPVLINKFQMFQALNRFVRIFENWCNHLRSCVWCVCARIFISFWKPTNAWAFKNKTFRWNENTIIKKDAWEHVMDQQYVMFIFSAHTTNKWLHVHCLNNFEGI